MEYAEKVIAGILPSGRLRLVSAITQLQQEHFDKNEITKNIFTLLKRYYDRTGEVVPLAVFEKAMLDAKIESAKVIAYTETFKKLSVLDVSDDQFSWSVAQLREESAKRKTGTAIVEGMEILDRGMAVGKEHLQGADDARRYLAAAIHKIDRLGNETSAPEGNILVERERLLEDYQARKAGLLGRGISLGIPAIDRTVGGAQRGELITVAGFTGAGKSQIVTQAAWNASVNNKASVLFATTETLRDQVIRRIIARHSRLTKFGKPEGINSQEIKNGLLSAADEKIYHDVLDDWLDGQASGEYGMLNVMQVPNGAPLSYVEMRLKEQGREAGCDLVVIDYLTLFKATIRRAGEREEINELIRDAKLMAVGFNDGQGIPVVSPWQISRPAWQQARLDGYYTLASLADTSEAEKSSDLIISLLKRDETNNRELFLQFLKVRDGEAPITGEEIAVDFRSSFAGDRGSVNTRTTFHAEQASEEPDFMSLLG